MLALIAAIGPFRFHYFSAAAPWLQTVLNPQQTRDLRMALEMAEVPQHALVKLLLICEAWKKYKNYLDEVTPRLE